MERFAELLSDLVCKKRIPPFAISGDNLNDVVYYSNKEISNILSEKNFILSNFQNKYIEIAINSKKIIFLFGFNFNKILKMCAGRIIEVSGNDYIVYGANITSLVRR